jgi:hypothetical protein
LVIPAGDYRLNNTIFIDFSNFSMIGEENGNVGFKDGDPTSEDWARVLFQIGYAGETRELFLSGNLDLDRAYPLENVFIRYVEIAGNVGALPENSEINEYIPSTSQGIMIRDVSNVSLQEILVEGFTTNLLIGTENLDRVKHYELVDVRSYQSKNGASINYVHDIYIEDAGFNNSTEDCGLRLDQCYNLIINDSTFSDNEYAGLRLNNVVNATITESNVSANAHEPYTALAEFTNVTNLTIRRLAMYFGEATETNTGIRVNGNSTDVLLSDLIVQNAGILTDGQPLLVFDTPGQVVIRNLPDNVIAVPWVLTEQSPVKSTNKVSTYSSGNGTGNFNFRLTLNDRTIANYKLTVNGSPPEGGDPVWTSLEGTVYGSEDAETLTLLGDEIKVERVPSGMSPKPNVVSTINSDSLSFSATGIVGTDYNWNGSVEVEFLPRT